MNTLHPIRSFSRTYTQQLGLLNQQILNTSFNLLEARILVEIDLGIHQHAQALTQYFSIDKGYLSRTLQKLERLKLIVRKPAKQDRRQMQIRLTTAGRKQLSVLHQLAEQQISSLLESYGNYEKHRIIRSLHSVNQILSQPLSPSVVDEIKIRSRWEAGDIGFVIQTQAELYHLEYRFSKAIERYIAQGIAAFLNLSDPGRSKIWMLSHGAQRIGFMLLWDRGNGVAQLRYFFLLPEYRGLGLGNLLLSKYMSHLKRHKFHTSYLLTTTEMKMAIHLYEKAGFQLVASKSSKQFGRKMIEQRYEWNR